MHFEHNPISYYQQNRQSVFLRLEINPANRTDEHNGDFDVKTNYSDVIVRSIFVFIVILLITTSIFTAVQSIRIVDI